MSTTAASVTPETDFLFPDVLTLWQDVEVQIRERDQHYRAAEQICAGIAPQLLVVNQERKAAREGCDRVRLSCETLLKQYVEALTGRIRSFRRRRKGIALQKLDFFDPQRYVFSTYDAHLLVGMEVVYDPQPYGRDRIPAQTYQWFSHLKNPQPTDQLLTPGVLSHLLTVPRNNRRTLQVKFEMLGAHGLYQSGYNYFSDLEGVRAYPRELFNDMQHLTLAQLHQAAFILEHPTRDLNLQEMK